MSTVDRYWLSKAVHASLILTVKIGCIQFSSSRTASSGQINCVVSMHVRQYVCRGISSTISMSSSVFSVEVWMNDKSFCVDTVASNTNVCFQNLNIPMSRSSSKV